MVQSDPPKQVSGIDDIGVRCWQAHYKMRQWASQNLKEYIFILENFVK